MKNITLSLQAIIFLFIIFLSAPIFAQEIKSDLPEAGLTPGDTFYFVDRASEQIKIGLTTDPITKTELLMDSSSERLAEAVILTEEGKLSEVERAIESYAKIFGVASSTLLNTDGTLNVEEVIRLKAQFATDSTRNLSILDSVSSQSSDIKYAADLASTQTISNQTNVISSIALTDERLAIDMYQKAVDGSIYIIQTKADTMADGTQISNLDSSIQDFNKYITYAAGTDFLSTNLRTIQDSVDGVASILSGTQTNTRVITGDVLNSGRVDSSINTVNPNSDGTVTADTGVPRIRSNDTGAPAYQSSSAELSWQEYMRWYILTR